MKSDPERSFQQMGDIQYLLRLPGIDHNEIRGYFEKYGQLDKYEQLTGKRK